MKSTTATSEMTSKGPIRRVAGGSSGSFCAIVVSVALALAGCGADDGGDGGSSAPDYAKALASAPPKLASLYDQGNELLEGGTTAFEHRLDGLRGHPVVVNKWASWCGPCRGEFPYLQRAAAGWGTKVGFLGVDGQDSEDAAKTFLDEYPVPYPSFSDPDEDIIDDVLDASVGYPSTVFYDSEGDRVYTKIGPYESSAELEADIKRYSN